MANQEEEAMQGEEMRRGTWLEEEDERLVSLVQLMGERRWDALAKASCLKRSGKSCRLRWLNYLCPNLKHGQISVEEENIILELHEKWGNKWSKIARRLPGRTDNEVKNYWRTHLGKRLAQVQEGKSQYELEKASGDFVFENKIESNSKKNTSHEISTTHDHGSVEDIWGSCSWDNSSEASGISSADFALTSSPYENRLSDWISEYSSDIQSEMNYNNDCFTIESASSSYPEYWSTTPDYSYTWDCSGSLWDMN